MEGWIKLHRKIVDSAISKSPEYFSVWIHLLIMASHQEKEVIFNGSKISMKPGSFITSRQKISARSGVDESKVERILKHLKNEQQIEQQNLIKGRLISIINWSKYQAAEQKTEQEMNTKRTPNEQQMNTIKNGKNVENERIIKPHTYLKILPSRVQDVIAQYKDSMVGAHDKESKWDAIFQRTLGCSCKEAMKILDG